MSGTHGGGEAGGDAGGAGFSTSGEQMVLSEAESGDGFLKEHYSRGVNLLQILSGK